MIQNAPSRPRHSPCVDICVLDERTGWCLGCGRTIDEIAAWGALDEAAREAIWRTLPDRMIALSERKRSARDTASEREPTLKPPST